jgi:hypothetical protein
MKFLLISFPGNDTTIKDLNSEEGVIASYHIGEGKYSGIIFLKMKTENISEDEAIDIIENLEGRKFYAAAYLNV